MNGMITAEASHFGDDFMGFPAMALQLLSQCDMICSPLRQPSSAGQKPETRFSSSKNQGCGANFVRNCPSAAVMIEAARTSVAEGRVCGIVFEPFHLAVRLNDQAYKKESFGVR
jgi:DnaK suppressor protein